MRKRPQLFLASFALITLGSVWMAFWAVAAINISGIFSTGWTAAELIRERVPIRLVQPEWVQSDDRLWSWFVAEIHARLVLVAFFWIGSSGILIWKHFKQQR